MAFLAVPLHTFSRYLRQRDQRSRQNSHLPKNYPPTKIPPIQGILSLSPCSCHLSILVRLPICYRSALSAGSDGYDQSLCSSRVFAIDSSCTLHVSIVSTGWRFCLVTPSFGTSVSTPGAPANDASCVPLSNIRPWPDYAKRYLRSASLHWLRSGQPFISELKSSGFSGSFYKNVTVVLIKAPGKFRLANLLHGNEEYCRYSSRADQ